MGAGKNKNRIRIQDRRELKSIENDKLGQRKIKRTKEDRKGKNRIGKRIR